VKNRFQSLPFKCNLQRYTEAGFQVVSGRKLLGIYELVGMFNSVDEWEGLDAALGEKPPGFGIVDFAMTFDTYMPCGGENTSKVWLLLLLALFMVFCSQTSTLRQAS
jgi:hypothetical protein